MADLEQRYRALSRQFHPDYFHNASAAERRSSLERSSYLNDAYRTLKNPIARVEYLLKLEGLGTGERAGTREREGFSRATTPPASLLEEVFALNEELDEIRAMKSSGAPADQWKARLERARKPIEEKRDEHAAQLESLSDRWDGALNGSAEDKKAILTALNERILERNYITNLLAGIDRELKAESENCE